MYSTAGLTHWSRCLSEGLCAIILWFRNKTSSASETQKENLWILHGANHEILGWFGNVLRWHCFHVSLLGKIILTIRLLRNDTCKRDFDFDGVPSNCKRILFSFKCLRHQFRHLLCIKCTDLDGLHGFFDAVLVHGSRKNGTYANVARSLLDSVHYNVGLRESSWNRFLRTSGNHVSYIDWTWLQFDDII